VDKETDCIALLELLILVKRELGVLKMSMKALDIGGNQFANFVLLHLFENFVEETWKLVLVQCESE